MNKDHVELNKTNTRLATGIRLALKYKTFQISIDNYLQLVGTTIGTIFTQTYPNIVVRYLEFKLHVEIENTF